jgi:hypothetical protein
MDEVESIGISGNKDPLPKAGEGDIDIFIYCKKIPGFQKRLTVMNKADDLLQECKINVFEGGHWGTGDFGTINGVETWLMYFTVNETMDEVESILNGVFPDKLDNYYYPVGRCAMLKDINALYDKSGFLFTLKRKLLVYPEKLSKSLAQYHMEQLDDREDLERAVARKDVLFYHFALDIAIDHFLQALFAINKTYFPSRKRTPDFIERFDIKPDKCSDKLLDAVKMGGFVEYMDRSYRLLISLVNDLKRLYEG